MRSGQHRDDEAAGWRREELLKAAARHFARYGYHVARTRDIAREAGVSEGTLYNHFQSKATLFAQVVAGINRRIKVAAAEGLSDGLSAREQFLRLAANLEGHFEANRDHAVILCREPVNLGVAAKWKVLAEEHLGFLETLLSALAQELGQRTSPAQGRALALSFLGAIHLMLVQWCVDDLAGPMEPGPVRYAENLISILEDSGRAGGQR